MSKVYEAVGQLVRRYREERGMVQAEVAAQVAPRLGRNFTQGMVSKLEAGAGWSDNPELLGVFTDILAIPQDEMVAALGFSVPGEKAHPTSLVDVVAQDSSLSDAAKTHLINQYGLLQLASLQERKSHRRVKQVPELEVVATAARKTTDRKRPTKTGPRSAD